MHLHTKEQVDRFLFSARVNPQNRFQAFLACRKQHHLAVAIYGYALGQAMRHSQRYSDRATLRRCLRWVGGRMKFHPRTDPYLMNEEEKRFLAALPNSLTLCQQIRPAALKQSALPVVWSISEAEGAEMPAPGKGFVWHQVRVGKRHIQALFLREGRAVVVYSPPVPRAAGMWVEQHAALGIRLVDRRQGSCILLDLRR